MNIPNESIVGPATQAKSLGRFFFRAHLSQTGRIWLICPRKDAFKQEAAAPVLN